MTVSDIDNRLQKHHKFPNRVRGRAPQEIYLANF